MPRSRLATHKEIETALTTRFQRLFDAALKPKARKRLKEHLIELDKTRQFYQWLLTFRELSKRDKKQLREALRADPLRVPHLADRHPITVDDLAVFVALLDAVISFLTGPASANLVGLGLPLNNVASFLNRLDDRLKPKHRKFKKEFVDAYRARKEARAAGRVVTIKQLAQQITPARYQANPFSAIHSMEQGLKRIEADEMKHIPPVDQRRLPRRRKEKRRGSTQRKNPE